MLAIVLRRKAPAQTPSTGRVDELFRHGRAALEALVHVQARLTPRGHDFVQEISRRNPNELEVLRVLAPAISRFFSLSLPLSRAVTRLTRTYTCPIAKMPWLFSLRLIGILLSYLAISLLQAPAHDVLDAEALRLVDAQRVGLYRL